MSRAGQRDAASPLRTVVEAGLLLAIGVALFREFAAEGYMITTGSMAPTLLGYHRRYECDSCKTVFATGAAAELGLTQSAVAEAESDISVVPKCPNCGLLSRRDLERSPTEGDQLLVHRSAFALRAPRRWETVVFRNPADLSQAFVKRVVGLPGEAIRIYRGDVYTDGDLSRKPLAIQRAVRIPVYDATHKPTDVDWAGRWQTDAAVLRAADGFRFPQADDWLWVRYRHWTRVGGEHRTSVLLDEAPDVDTRHLTEGRVAFRGGTDGGELLSVGVVRPEDVEALTSATRLPGLAAAVRTLSERSHVAPVTDDYAYNKAEGKPHFIVRDLMWSGRVRMSQSAAVRVRVLYGRQPFEVVLDSRGDRAVLATPREDGSAGILEECVLPPSLRDGAELTVSVFDRQVVVAVDDQLLFAPLPFAETPLSGLRTRTPVRFAARGGRVDVSDVRLYRDIYYTPKGDADSDRTLAGDEFFVLGDNSPVSVDSRVWDARTVRLNALVGKPFVVHLPSRRRDLPLAGDGVRVPDWSRARLIR